jgi:dolichol kinase
VVERKRLFRRGFHMASSLFVVYYALPPVVPGLELRREHVALLGLALLTAFEAYRISHGWLFFGLREYEKHWVAGYYWGAAGYVVALLFFEQRFAMVTILGTTLVDPLIGELRQAGLKRAAPAAGLGAWTAVALTCIFLVPLPTPLALVPVGAAIAVAAESTKVPRVDDNFIMNLAPLVALTATAAVLGL